MFSSLLPNRLELEQVNMVDNLTPENRHKAMKAVKAKGTSIERCLSSMLAGLGIRGWTRNDTSVLGKPDVIFARQRVAIFVEGCFWHGCPHHKRILPATNRDYWESKIARNVARSRANARILRAGGWTVIRIWEHELKDSLGLSKTRVKILNALRTEKQNEQQAGR